MTSRWQKYNREDYQLEHENLVFLDDESEWLDEDEEADSRSTLPSKAVFHEGPIY